MNYMRLGLHRKILYLRSLCLRPPYLIYFEVKRWSVKETLLFPQVYFNPLGNKLKYYISSVDFTPTPNNIKFETLTNQKKILIFILDNESNQFCLLRAEYNLEELKSERSPGFTIMSTNNHTKSPNK